MSARRRLVAIGAVVGVAIAVAALLAWFGGRDGRPGGMLVDADAATIEAGRVVYARHCASCHGERLQGEPDWRARKPNGRLPAPPHDDSGHTWHHPDEQLIAITTLGMKPPLAPEGYESDMPGFGGVLGDREIFAVLAFIASRWSPESRAHQARVTRAR